MASKSRSVFSLLLLLIIVSVVLSTAFAEDKDNTKESEQWFLRGRRYQGKVAPELLKRAQQQRDALRGRTHKGTKVGMANTQGGTTPIWTELGPAPLKSVAIAGDDQDYGPITGRATTVAVDQNDLTGNTVYLGGAYGGVWKSTNAANSDITKVTWKPLIDDQQTIAVGAIAVQPGNGSVLLVGTGEANSSSDSYYGLGILRSTDAGNSWTLIDTANNGLRPFHGLAFSKIAFSSDNPSLVVAAAASASEGLNVGAENPANNPVDCANAAVIATCRGLYYSFDAGITWNQVTMKDAPSTAPDNASASAVVYNSIQHKFYAASRAHGLYVSADGITFTRMGSDVFGFSQPNVSSLSTANCPPSPTNLSTCPLYRAEIAAVPGRDEMYVWYVDASSTPVNGGIYQTKNGGKTWTSLNVSGINNCGDAVGCGVEQGYYNLALMAVPNGATATDLYAGAVNIYRCQINSNNTACNTNGFVNLTHVYGCSPTGSFSKVHPDQHWFDFVQSNPSIAFFANDGGIYRTLAALSANNIPTSCPATPPSAPLYPFENLNGAMGSMTQFVWFSQDASDAHTLLGGTRNGTAAVDSANSGPNGLTWSPVLAGNSGFTEINPDNGNEWFASNPRVNIFRCTSGTSCTDSQFEPAVNSFKLGGDSAAFYMPYMLDPQDSTKLIAGTCRVWRTDSTGTSSIALSQNFATGVLGSTCASASSTFISALAAGGPTTSSGSQVIYAGTDDGRVFATTSAITSATTWAAVSGNPGFTNPAGYPISSIVLDLRDATGQTAFVTVMGFRTSHVFRTSDAGSTWTDITGNIPDAPVNAVVVDKSTGAIYVGTDVGVFSTDTPNGANTVWTEVGPSTGTGALPNVAVTHLAIFASQDAPARLRASTYGRGLWETILSDNPEVPTPDFTLSISNPSLLTFPNQTVTFNGTLTIANGYNNTIAISCEATSGSLPSTCLPNPASLNPATATSFTASVANSTVGDFNFRIKGVGADPNALVRQTAVTLRVIDFSLSASPSTITNLVQGTSTTVQLTVNSLGSFDQSVAFTCEGLPAGMTCNSSPATLSPGGSTQSTLTITADSSTPAGSYNLNIIGTWAAASRTQAQPISVTVTVPASDYSLSFGSSASGTVEAGGIATANLAVTAVGAFNSTVSLTVSGCPPSATCSLNTTTVSPTSSIPATSALTITTKSNSNGFSGTPGGTYNIVVTGTSGSTIRTANYTLTVNDFLISGSGNGATLKAGGTATGTFTISASGAFNSAVDFTLSGCPSNATCSIAPNPVTPTANTPAAATLTIVTKAPSIASLHSPGSLHNYLAIWIAFSCAAFGILILKPARRATPLLLIACTLLTGLTACGGGGGGSGSGTPPVPVPGTPAGTYTIVVTGTAGTTVKTVNFTLTVQ